MDIGRNLAVIVDPGQIGIAWGIDALKADTGNLAVGSNGGYRLVELRGKGMCRIDHQTDLVGMDERRHRLGIHRPVDMPAMLQREVLLARLRAIEEW